MQPSRSRSHFAVLAVEPWQHNISYDSFIVISRSDKVTINKVWVPKRNCVCGLSTTKASSQRLVGVLANNHGSPHGDGTGL